MSADAGRLPRPPPRVSIVIPVYNSEQTIGPLVDRLVQEIGAAVPLQVVLVNDGSRDRSDAVCEELFRRHRGLVKYYALARNVGEHNAVMAGLNHADGDYVVIMDDDFQNDTAEVRKLIDAATAGGHDVVYTYYPKRHHAWWRNLGSRFNDRVASVMLRKPKDLYLSSFKAMNRFLVREVVKYEAPFPYIDGLILRTTDRIGRVEVEHHRREAGHSGYTLAKLVSLWMNMFTNFSVLPLRISVFAGFAFAAVGLGLAVYTVWEKMANPHLPVGWAAATVMGCLFSGVQLVAIGMIGEYVGRIFLSLNRQPQFTIRKALEPEPGPP